MSPNVAIWVVLIAATVLLIIGGMIVITNWGDELPPVFAGSALLLLGGFACWAGVDLHTFATGQAHYEKLDNPDGTRTWQRIEVTK